MSFSSRSSNRNHYKKSNNGSNHYQKKGIFGSLLNMMGSFSKSDNKYKNANMQNKPMNNQNSISCNKCSSHIPAGSKFCLQCGESVSAPLFCMSCGEKLPPNAKFCLKCGNKISQ